MEKAARLLREEDISIQDVIADVGIASRSYFYKEFARKYGMTPKDYREQQKKYIILTCTLCCALVVLFVCKLLDL